MYLLCFNLKACCIFLCILTRVFLCPGFGVISVPFFSGSFVPILVFMVHCDWESDTFILFLQISVVAPFFNFHLLLFM